MKLRVVVVNDDWKEKLEELEELIREEERGMHVSSIISALARFRKVQGDVEVDFLDVRGGYIELTYVDKDTGDVEVEELPIRREENVATK